MKNQAIFSYQLNRFSANRVYENTYKIIHFENTYKIYKSNIFKKMITKCVDKHIRTSYYWYIEKMYVQVVDSVGQ